MSSYEGGYIGKQPTWRPGGNPSLSGAWSIQDVSARAERNEWGFFEPLPVNPGDPFGGGFFVGYISYTANSVPTHGLIVAPSATGYNNEAAVFWSTSPSNDPGTLSVFDGAANTASIASNKERPPAYYCASLRAGGYDDWYLPAWHELEIAYFNLKPTTQSNNTNVGENPYAVPARNTDYGLAVPALTSAAAFQSGGAEAFITGAHWTSTCTTDASTSARYIRFSDGLTLVTQKNLDAYYVRAFRKFAL